MVQCLRLSVFTAGGAGLIPGWGSKTKIPHASWPGIKKKKKERKAKNLKVTSALSLEQNVAPLKFFTK